MKHKPVILLIDDDEDDHHIFNTAAQNAAVDCQVYNAYSAEQGLQMLEDLTPGFVFLDMHMPRIDGIEFLGKLKERYKEFPFQVVMFSTGMTKDLCDQAVFKGASFCVKKPSSIKELEKVLIQVCIEKTAYSQYLFD